MYVLGFPLFVSQSTVLYYAATTSSSFPFPSFLLSLDDQLQELVLHILRYVS